MRVRGALAAGCALACLVTLVGGCSGSRGEAPKAYRRGESGPNPVPEEGPWKEAEVALPPFPQDSDLIEFQPTGLTRFKFFIDGSSLSVGPDAVIRFSLVIRSPEGARTVSYSGVRCKSREWKDFAYGRGTRWEPNSDPAWRPIIELNSNNYQYTLASDYFCFGGVFSAGPKGSAKTIVRGLKYPTAPDTRSPRDY